MTTQETTLVYRVDDTRPHFSPVERGVDGPQLVDVRQNPRPDCLPFPDFRGSRYSTSEENSERRRLPGNPSPYFCRPSPPTRSFRRCGPQFEGRLLYWSGPDLKDCRRAHSRTPVPRDSLLRLLSELTNLVQGV